MPINSKTKKTLLTALAYVMLFLVISQAASWWKSRDAMTGDLSGFRAELMDGAQVILSDYEGRPVLFYFWATWCPICGLQKGSVESIAEDYPVVTIASWSEPEEVTAYMRKHELTFPVMMDEQGQLAKDFGLKGVPVSFILSPSGEIEFVDTGYTSELGLRLRLWLASM